MKPKARLVVQGFSRVTAVGFEETFAPAGPLGSLNLLLAIAAAGRKIIVQRDFEGVQSGRPNQPRSVHKWMRRKGGCDAVLLVKSLYVLKQSVRNGHSTAPAA